MYVLIFQAYLFDIIVARNLLLTCLTMSFRQVYVRNEVWPKVVLKRLSVSLTHPYQCTRCKEQFHKIHEATAHYLCSHQNSNDLPKKEIPENDTKIKIEKFDDPIKMDIKIEIKKEIKCETDVQRGFCKYWKSLNCQ